MELTDRTAHRALLFVAAVQRQGYSPTEREFDAYMSQPSRKAGRPEVKRPMSFAETWASNLLDNNRETVRSLLAAVYPGKEVVVDPGEPGESILQWLERLQWLRNDAGRVRMTALGEAVLGHLEQAQLDEDMPVALTLDVNDPTALARVTERIAEVGECALVDGYLRLEQFAALIQTTNVRQILTGPNDKPRLAGLTMALAGLPEDRHVEVRISDVFHDRFVIPDSGPVWLIGTSMGGISKRLSVMVRLDDDQVATAIRAQFAKAWEKAEILKVPEVGPGAPKRRLHRPTPTSRTPIEAHRNGLAPRHRRRIPLAARAGSLPQRRLMQNRGVGLRGWNEVERPPRLDVRTRERTREFSSACPGPRSARQLRPFLVPDHAPPTSSLWVWGDRGWEPGTGR